MGRRVFVLFLVSLVTFTTPVFARSEDLAVPDLETLALPTHVADRVVRILPSKPGDTFLQLRNGMTVLIRENHASRVVSSQVLVKTGSIYEGKYFFGGLSHYLEHVVAGGSTESFTEADAQQVLRSLGGASNAYTSYDRTVYFINTTADHYREALRLLLSYVSECRLDPKEVEREKAVIQQEFKLGETNPSRQLWKLFVQTAYLKHPIRHPVIGYEDVFVNISREDLLDYYKKRYTPQNMIVTIVGDVQTAEALQTVLELSKNMVRTFDPPTVVESEPSQNAPRWAEKKFAPARLTSMIVGFHTVSLTQPDLYPLDLLAVILGQGRTSRLYLGLKDKRELVLSVDASSWTPSYGPGVFSLTVSLDRKNVESTLTALWDEIELVQEDLVEESELEKAKRKIVAEFTFSKQSAAQIASSLATSVASTGDPYFDNLYVERIKSVSREDIRRVARTYLRKEVSTVGIVAPPTGQSRAAETSVPRAAGRIEKVTLENGLTLLLKRNPTLPIVNFQVFGLGGQRYEGADLSGISLFTMDLLTKGTGTRSKRQISETIERLGGSMHSGSGRNTYYMSLSVLKDGFETGMELLADVLRNPDFPQREIDKQRADTLLAIRRLDENWQHEVARLFRKHYYQEHPYHNDLLGAEETVQGFNRSAVQRFYRRVVMPNNAVLAIFGDIDPEETLAKVKSLFGNWRPEKLTEPVIPDVRALLTADTRIQKTTEKVSAGILVGTNGVTVADPDRPTLDVIDAVLSGIGYPSGWLHEALRGGDRSLVYVIHAFPSAGVDVGHFAILTQTTMANYATVVEIILEKLERIQREPLSTEELEAAKDMCITMHEMSLESNGAQARSAAVNEILGLGYDWDSHYPQLIRSVTAEDVLRVARNLFRYHLLVSTIPENPVEAIIPPERKERTHVD
ncbi:MAG: insulinase family protein [Deltaproteobacteria bacterium]|nr:MAG: insulinase family protein [Deltaproteobacteria bacterium]